MVVPGLFLFHFSVSILRHQNKNANKKRPNSQIQDRIYKSKIFGLHLHKQNFKTNYKRIMAEDCNEVIKKSLHTRLLQQC